METLCPLANMQYELQQASKHIMTAAQQTADDSTASQVKETPVWISAEASTSSFHSFASFSTNDAGEKLRHLDASQIMLQLWIHIEHLKATTGHFHPNTVEGSSALCYAIHPLTEPTRGHFRLQRFSTKTHHMPSELLKDAVTADSIFPSNHSSQLDDHIT